MGAKRAGVVGVDIEPNVSQIGSKVEAAARLLKPLGLRVKLDNDFTRELEAGVGKSRRSLDSIDTGKAQGELRQLGTAGDRELGRIESKAKLSSTALLTVGAGAVAVGTKIISGLRPAADAASDLNEAVAYGETVFGESFAAVDKFATGAAEKIGQSRREAIAGATDFATLGKAAGLAGDDLAGFSTDLVTLASDLASARNTSTADAIQAISAGLRGEAEPLRRYGVLLDIGTKVFERKPVDLAMGAANVIWQGDANSVVIRSLALCSSPAAALNLTGPETLSVRYIAQRFGQHFGVDPIITGEEAPTALLNNAAKCQRIFGYPSVTPDQMIEWIAGWIGMGGASLGKPTKFAVRDGKF